MILNELEIYSRFRGLQPGFKVQFVRPAHDINKVNPICFVGLNGSGKSNLMQLLAEIFYYLELYVLPDSQGYFDPAAPFGFCIRYSIPVTPRNFLEGVDDSLSLSTLTWRHVLIDKKNKARPIFQYWYDGKEITEIPQDRQNCLLPNQVIGYSSGMNELISLPFLKMDFYYLSMMRRKMTENNQQSVADEIPAEDHSYSAKTNVMTVNRLFYLDYHSNALMILANYLASENIPGRKNEQDIINDILGIEDVVSFEVAVNFWVKEEIGLPQFLGKMMATRSENPGADIDISQMLKQVEIPPEINSFINTLVDCSTTMNMTTGKDLGTNINAQNIRVELYFKVDNEMKRAFRDKVRGGPMQLFQQFYLLNLLNIDNYSAEIQQQVKKMEGTNLDVKSILSGVAKEDKVFVVDNIRLKKKSGVIISYSQLSDGEHQYMQVAGALKLITENATLFLMDEPETHFNPEWRSTLFSTLNNILKRRMENDPDAFIPRQEIVVTSHSPFIVSDCQSEQVYIFERDRKTGFVKQPMNPDFNTYGASANFLTAKVFGKKETIAGLANEQLKKLKTDVEAGAKTKDQAMEEVNQLGDSVEKIMFLDEMSKMK